MSRSHAEHAPPQTQIPSLTPHTVRSFKLSTVLVALVVAALVPALTTAVFAVSQSVQAYREASAARLADTARTLAHTIEAELSTKATLLQTMGVGIGSGGITRDQAQHWLSGLRSAQGGRFVMSTIETVPGATEPRFTTEGLPRALVLEAIAQNGVSLSNLFNEPGAGRPAVALSMPLPPSGTTTLLLSLVMPVEQLLSLAPQHGTVDDSMLVAVTDGTGHLVARSRDGERLIGHPVPDWQKLKSMGTPSGQFTAQTAEGMGVMLSFETLAATPGWVLVIGEPQSAFDAAWQRPLRQLATGSALGTLLALLVAIWLARVIARPAHDLARNAQAVVAATDADAPAQKPAHRSLITEFEAMRSGIESAQTALQARAEAERRNAQALALNELRYRTLARTGAVVLWRAAPDGQLRSADGWEQLTGEPDAQALGKGWVHRLHPDDRALMETALATRLLDQEFRISRQDGSWCWVRGRGTPVPTEDGVVREWVGVLEDVSERHSAQARVAHMALHDALTDLPNRVAFRHKLDNAIRRASRGDASSVLYIDLDRFKAVNDTLGHSAGDELLLMVASRLRGLVRQDDTVARLAGDEFAIIQSRLNDARDAAELATRVVQSLSEPYTVSGHHVSIGASVGIMLIHDDSCDADRLLNYADMALYRAKQEGRGRHSFFEPEMDTQLQERRRNEQQLREALASDSLELSYAPQVDAHRRRLSGVSVALHWSHPQRGRLSGAEFESMADELALSGPLVAWTLQRVCTDLSTWPECPKAAVDVSAALRWGADALCEGVDAALAKTGLAPGRLELEIGESAVMACPEMAERAVRALQARGVQVTLSRFGSDSSALGQLRQLPFHKIKIERAMLQAGHAGRRPGQASLRAVALLCEELGIAMGVDGVETAAQLECLPTVARMELQGALFGGHRAAADVPAVCQALAAATQA
jgi:diguanylate cyclase (GGDEF)-like protein/PAS domain S-box-containing protein